MEARNLKVERNQKVSPMESVMRGRRRFSDISNTTNQQQKLARPVAEQENPNPVPISNTKDYVMQLIKENTALLRLLEERNKIIELSGLELQKLRLDLQKAHQQNWQLSQANTQMLAELNLGKEKLKTLQHELGCTVAVLKAKNFELEEKVKLNKQLYDKISTMERPTKCAEVAIDPPNPNQTSNKKPCNPNRKRTSRYNSVGSSTVTHQVAGKEKDDNRRRSLRRRSSNFRSQPCEPREDLSEIEDAKFPVHSLLTDPVNEDNPIQLDSLVAASNSSSIAKPDKEEGDKDGSGSSHYQNQETRRSSVGRPLRMAKVGVSYKEIPLNVKMRRQ